MEAKSLFSKPPLADLSWAEASLQPLDLEAARRLAKDHQKQTGPSRAPWKSLPLTAHFFEDTKVLGLFSPRKNWDEGLLSFIPPTLATAFPRIVGTEMSFHLCRPEALVLNHEQGIYEAPASAPLTQPDLLIVPCLLADGFGHRMGRGKGHYDRYLSTRPGLSAWGLVHSDYILNEFPVGWIKPWDQKLTGLLTDCSAIPIQEINL